jgi:hypothetical protein
MPTTPSMTFEPNTNRVDPVYAPNLSRLINIAPNPSSTSTAVTTYSKGTLMAEFTNTSLAGVYTPYNSTSGSGVNIPKGILQYTVSVDSAGNVALAGEFGQTQKGCPMWMPGGAVWNAADIVGLDANAVSVMQGAYVEGAGAVGLIRL